MVANSDWMEANKTLSPYGLQLYLYLASNIDDYKFALSPAAALDYAGIKSTTFHKYMRLLEIEGYLVWRSGNIYDFYTSPRDPKDRTHPDNHYNSIFFEDEPLDEVSISDGKVNDSVSRKTNSPNELPLSPCDPISSHSDIEIDNREIENNRKSTIDNIDAGKPRTPAEPTANAVALPSKAEVGRNRFSTQKPKRKPFAFLDVDEFDF